MWVKTEDLAKAEKEGFFTGRYALNPCSGEKLRIGVGNFALLEYVTGALMAVPAHDERDFEFCKKYNLPIRTVVIQVPRDLGAGAQDAVFASGSSTSATPPTEAFTEYGVSINSGEFSGLPTEQAKEKMSAFARSKGFGEKETIFRLKDWGISRQRYWGTPIPVIYCPKDGLVPVPDKDLPVVLPPNPNLTDESDSALATTPQFVSTACS